MVQNEGRRNFWNEENMMLYLVDEEDFYFTSDNGKHVLYFAASFMPAILNYHGLFHEG